MVTLLTRMSCDYSLSYALQSLWNSPYSEVWWYRTMQTIVRSTARLIQWELYVASQSQSQLGWGGVWDMYTRSAVTSFNSCHNPELETVSPSRLHWIRPDLKGCTATFSKASFSHDAFQLPILHGLSEFIPFNSKKRLPPLQRTDSLWDMR